MKNQVLTGVSNAAVSAMAKLDTTVAFLLNRREGLDLAPAGRQTGSAFVWRRVFLKGRSRRP